MAVLRVSHIGICVSDLTRSTAFYRDQLGFRPVSALDVAGEDAEKLLELDDLSLHAVYLERDGTRIELLDFPSPGCERGPVPRPMNQLGLTHLSLRVDDLGSTLESMRDAGVEILEGTRIGQREYGVDVVFVLDPDGLRVELVQSPGDASLLPGQSQ